MKTTNLEKEPIMKEDDFMKAEHDALVQISEEMQVLQGEIDSANLRMAWLKKDAAKRQHFFVLNPDGTLDPGIGCF